MFLYVFNLLSIQIIKLRPLYYYNMHVFSHCIDSGTSFFRRRHQEEIFSDPIQFPKMLKHYTKKTNVMSLSYQIFSRYTANVKINRRLKFMLKAIFFSLLDQWGKLSHFRSLEKRTSCRVIMIYSFLPQPMHYKK